MYKYIFSRLLQLIPLVLAITFITFAIMYNAAGDAVDVLYDMGGGASEVIKSEQRAILGLDRPFIVQYLVWLKGFLIGDMGSSYISGKRVLETFLSRLPNTIYLMLSSIFLTLLISIPLGIVSALKRNCWPDYLIRIISFAGNSMPGFFIALLLIYIFALQLNWLPVLGSSGPQAIVLPTVALTISMAAKYTRQVRAAVLEELSAPYVSGARARGVAEFTIITASVLRTAMLTIVTLLALSIGSLLGGTAIIETIFMWEGVGKLAVDSIVMRDYPIIQSYVIWMSIIYVIINLLTDILCHYLDPRLRILHKE